MMKFCCRCVLVATLTLALARAQEDHDHDHGDEPHHTCACEAEEMGFTINCADQDAMLQALAILQDPDNDCLSDCSSETCLKNYLIVQSHHDYCLHDEVPEPLEDGIHFFEGECEDCGIKRKPDPNLPDCPTVSCNTDDGGSAYLDLLTGGCLDSCSEDGCADNYRILRATHDTCPEDTLDQTAEQGLHDFEEVCEVHNCNTHMDDGMTSQLVCTETSAVAGSTVGWLVPVALGVVAAIVA